MNVKLRRYKKKFDHSYAIGVFPTLELLKYRPDNTLGVVIHSKGQKNQGVIQILRICQKEEVPVHINDKAVSRLTNRGNDYAIGIFQKRSPSLDHQSDHVVLVNPRGMGNLGTIMRAMIGFGFRDLAVIEPAADIYDPKVVRASMGAFFQINTATFSNFEIYRKMSSRHIYPTMTDGEVTLDNVSFQSPFAVVFGNESSGLDRSYHNIGTSVRIPHSKAIDSLNLALAVGVTLYQVWKSK